MALKSLAAKVLARNAARNSGATLPENTRNSGATLTQRELRDLVHRCGVAYGFSNEELALATELALADPETALTCFRAIAAELGIEALKRIT